MIPQAEDPDVCDGAISREGPILAHDLREMTTPSHTAQLFCTTLFGLCDYPAVTQYTVPFPSPKPNTARPSPSGQTPLKVVHISDIHVDLSYEVGANYNCTKNICCRPYTSADAPGNTSFPAGPYGEHTCDTPASLEQSLYAAINDLVSDAAFTLFTGDVVEGAVWLTTQTEVTNDLQDAYGKMASSPGLKRVYGVVGNHDTNPVNSWPPVAVDTTITSQWAYDTLSSVWSTWIGTAPAATADQNPGFYTVLIPDTNLRIISFNMNMYYKENFWLYEPTIETDPSGQLKIIVNALQAAEDAGERVYIIGHMPMGSGDALHDGSNYFDQIVNRYEATIAALSFGKYYLCLLLHFLPLESYPTLGQIIVFFREQQDLYILIFLFYKKHFTPILYSYLSLPASFCNCIYLSPQNPLRNIAAFCLFPLLTDSSLRPHPQRRVPTILHQLLGPERANRSGNFLHRASPHANIRPTRLPRLHHRPRHLRRARHNNLHNELQHPTHANEPPSLERILHRQIRLRRSRNSQHRGRSHRRTIARVLAQRHRSASK